VQKVSAFDGVESSKSSVYGYSGHYQKGDNEVGVRPDHSEQVKKNAITGFTHARCLTANDVFVLCQPRHGVFRDTSYSS